MKLIPIGTIVEVYGLRFKVLGHRDDALELRYPYRAVRLDSNWKDAYNFHQGCKLTYNGESLNSEDFYLGDNSKHRNL